MTGRLRISQLDIWGRHSRSVMSVLLEALRLCADDSFSGAVIETDMTNQLFLGILKARRALLQAGEDVPDGIPAIDGRNSPSPGTIGTTAVRKLPDIQWGYQDDTDPEPVNSARVFHIECKRLGDATLDGKYVDEGVVRFTTLVHRYGKDVSDGAMVGYVVAGDLLDALPAVNERLSSVGLSPITVASSYAAAVSCLSQRFARPYAKSPFTLQHVWVVTVGATTSLPAEEGNGTVATIASVDGLSASAS
jgi:hypothetical protein